MSLCKVPDCGKPRWARGLCSAHLYHWRKGKLDIAADERLTALPYGDATCSVVECCDPATEHGMCGRHAQRVRRYGDASYLTPEDERRQRNREAQLARGIQAKPTTYRKRMGRHEHRIVAEEKLGRPLEKGEVVHHEDEDKHNNEPSNLIVFRSQHEHALYHAIKNAARRLASIPVRTRGRGKAKTKDASSRVASK